MNAKVCGQTLILVDNDATVSSVNQKIIKNTLKYMFYHAPEDRAFCLNTYGHELEAAEEYTRDTNELLCNLDLMEFSPKDSNLTDVLTGVITNWKESDFACRDILIFTDGIEGANTRYELQELYYMIENTAYPVYIVNLVQDNNDSARKELSAIATTSGGKLFLSEYPGDDAGVDKHLSEEIYGKMNEYALINWGQYQNDGITEGTETDIDEKSASWKENASGENLENLENLEKSDEDGNQKLKEEEGNIEGNVISQGEQMDQFEETIIESPRQESILSNPWSLSLVLLIVIVVITIGFVASFLIMKSRKRIAKQEKEILDEVKEKTKLPDIAGNPFMLDSFDCDSDDEVRTMLLREEEEGTRLLNSYYTHDLELTDMENSSNVRLLPIEDYLVCGRKQEVSDIVFDDDSVSKRHCEFSYSNGEYYVSDLDSANGTFVNGDRITRKKISTGDKIRIGRSVYLVKCI